MSRGTEGRRSGPGLASLGHELLQAPAMGRWELRTGVGGHSEGMLGCWLRPVKHPALKSRLRAWIFCLVLEKLGLLP